MKYLIRFLLGVVPRKYLQRFSHRATRFLSLFYTGSAVQCPVCNHRYRKFLPYGYVKPRENALCPHCLSLERHRLMYIWLKEKTDFFEGSHTILHIAPEYCFLNRFESRFGDAYITADLESPLAKVHLDVQKMPFANDHFDVVICNHILEHVEDDALALREIFRVLKPGGWGLILSPINPDRAVTYEDSSIVTPRDREIHFKQKDHLRDYGLDYPQRLERAGFVVTCDQYAHALPADRVKLHALPLDEVMYRVDKPGQ